MPRNLSNPAALSPLPPPAANYPYKPTSPIQTQEQAPKVGPEPLPVEIERIEREGPTKPQPQAEDPLEPGATTIEVKTSHLVAASALISFFLGAATLFFIHPAANSSLSGSSSLPASPENPKASTQIDQLGAQIQQKDSLIAKLKDSPRSRIALPAQTSGPIDPDKTIFTPQDSKTAVNWIAKAGSDITWLSNAPLDPAILAALSKRKSQGIPILVIAGKQALRANLEGALQAGYTVYQSPLSLAELTSILIIDSKVTLDLSNPDFVWASAEPTLVKDIDNYAINMLLKNAAHLRRR